MKIDKFNFFRSYFDGIKMLEKDQQLEAYNQIFEYVFDDVIPSEKSIAFTFIEHHLTATKDAINRGSSGGKVTTKQGGLNKKNKGPCEKKIRALKNKKEGPLNKKSKQLEQELELELELEQEENNTFADSGESASSYSEEFNNFWSSYKRKGSKIKAFQRWKEQKKKYTADQIMKALNVYNTELSEEKFRKYAEGWLNGYIDTYLEKALNPTLIVPKEKEKIVRGQAAAYKPYQQNFSERAPVPAKIKEAMKALAAAKDINQISKGIP